MSKIKINSSKLFCPNREIGRVTDGKKFVVNRLGNNASITTSVRNVFHVYSYEKLRVVIVSDPFPEEIEDLFCLKHKTIVLSSREVHLYNRHNYVTKIGEHEDDIVCSELISKFLITVDKKWNLKVWDVKRGVLTTEFQLLVDENDKKSIPTCICHPPTYLNKVLLGDNLGRLLLVNFVQNELIMMFDGDSLLSHENDPTIQHSTISPKSKIQSNVSVSCLTPSPVLDVVCVGYLDGRISLRNLKQNEILFQFKQVFLM